MLYPKPLSEKTLARMYLESGLSEQQAFLHQLFLAAANLYGIIDLRTLWDIYKLTRGEKTPSVKRKDIIAFSAIARREEVPYYIYEINEMFEDEKPKDFSRLIVHKEIIGNGRGKYNDFYGLYKTQQKKPVYIPKNIMDYVTVKPTPVEIQLKYYLGAMRVTIPESVTPTGEAVKCENLGKTLDSFSFMNASERAQKRVLESRKKKSRIDEKELHLLIDHTSCSEADKIINNFKRKCMFGKMEPGSTLREIVDELFEVGVELTKNEMTTLFSLVAAVANQTHVWINRGWTPSDLSQVMAGTEKTIEIKVK